MRQVIYVLGICSCVVLAGCDVFLGERTWYDPTTNLVWQNPQGDGSYSYDDAKTYCDHLSFGDGGDYRFRLPNVTELRSLIRKCMMMELQSSYEDDCTKCPVTDFNRNPSKCSTSDQGPCSGCKGYSSGPSEFYDPSLVLHFDVVWSSTEVGGTTDLAYWLVDFYDAGLIVEPVVGPNKNLFKTGVLCVRGQPFGTGTDGGTDGGTD